MVSTSLNDSVCNVLNGITLLVAIAPMSCAMILLTLRLLNLASLGFIADMTGTRNTIN